MWAQEGAAASGTVDTFIGLAGEGGGLAAAFHGQAACPNDQRARLKRRSRRRMAGGAPASVLLLGVHH